jgi:transcriptional regulator with XRE-family HTH domain
MRISEAIAKRTKDLLLQKNMTQYRLKKDMAMPHSTLINITRAKRNSGSVKTIFQVCKGLNVSVSEFFNDSVFEREDLEID